MLNLNPPLGLRLQYFFTFLAFLHELKNTRSCLMDLVLLHGCPCACGSIPCARPVTVGRDKGRELPLGLLSPPARAAVSGTDCLGVSWARFSSARSPCCC